MVRVTEDLNDRSGMDLVGFLRGLMAEGLKFSVDITLRNAEAAVPERRIALQSDPMVLQLMPVCMDNEEYAAEFLEAVRDKSALEITNAVKWFREQKKLNAQLCHHRLWELLSRNQIYRLGERNWNARIGY